jgi:hypothetical protein
MNSSKIAKSLVVVAFGGLLFATSVGTGASLTACGESSSCTQLRHDTDAQLQTWEQCDPADPTSCIIEQGNPLDCTGVLSCKFAINPHFRFDAEQAVQTMGEQSQGCHLCAIPNCASGDIPYCEPTLHKCMVVTSLIDAGGVLVPTGGTADTGAPVPVSDAATSGDVSLPSDGSTTD